MPSFPFFSRGPKHRPEASEDETLGERSPVCSGSMETSKGLGESRSEAGSPEWPFPGWARYQFEAFLGQGAMGEVYRVFDPVLNRSVALKVLNDGALRHADRFLSEARAMARVEHPNVAKIFEVGEEEGRSYLAMQLLHGDSLHVMRDRLNLEERVEMMRQACEGVQAAHRMGLLHRDLKPSNIVVEKDADGHWHAFVVDFGLACDNSAKEQSEGNPEVVGSGRPEGALAQVATPTATLAADVTGTPAFMSPEQAAGEPLDRRSDVFSLGSTLYAVLTGSPPFGGQSILSILGNVALTRQASLKEFEGKFPQDLDAIVQKAMEKDPLKRYPSVRSLSWDLKRWLNGEAVDAVQHKPFYRLGCWVRNNRTIAGLGVLLMLTLMGALGLGWLARARARDQARYYQYFCQEAERMEAKLALAESMPLHDTSHERQAVQAKMRQLEKEIARAGLVAEAPGYYALGRGYLALGKWGQARRVLEKAWNLGIQTPEVALALVDCLNQLYSAALAGHSGERRRELQASLDVEFKPLTIKYWALARQGLQGPEIQLAEAQMALVGEHYEEAQVKVDHILRDDPGHVRALLIKVEIDINRAENLALGEATLERVEALLRRARESSRSSPVVYEKQAAVYFTEMTGAIFQKQPFMGHFNQVLEALRLVRQANSQSLFAWETEAIAWCCLGDFSAEWYWKSNNKKNEFIQAMHHAMACADQALALDPASIDAINVKGLAMYYLSKWKESVGLDAQADLEKAIANYQEALQRPDPPSNWRMNLGICYALRGDRRQRQGVSPLPDYQAALECYSQAETSKKNSALTLNLSFVQWKIADFLGWQGQDATVPMRVALDYARRALSGNRPFDGQCSLARTYLRMAEILAWQGGVEREAWHLGMEHARQAMALQEQDPEARRLMVWAILLDSFTGGESPDLKTAERLIHQLRVSEGVDENFYYSVWLSLERYRRQPSWEGFWALETQINRGLKPPSIQSRLHFLALEGCRIAFHKRIPGPWRERLAWHARRAKALNPLTAPWVDQRLKAAGLE